MRREKGEEEGRRKKEEGRRKKEEGRRKREGPHKGKNQKSLQAERPTSLDQLREKQESSLEKA